MDSLSEEVVEKEICQVWILLKSLLDITQKTAVDVERESVMPSALTLFGGRKGGNYGPYSEVTRGSLPADDATSAPHERDTPVIQAPTVEFGGFAKQHESLGI